MKNKCNTCRKPYGGYELDCDKCFFRKKWFERFVFITIAIVMIIFPITGFLSGLGRFDELKQCVTINRIANILGVERESIQIEDLKKVQKIYE